MTEFKGMSVERQGDEYRVVRETREAKIEVGLGFDAYRPPQLATTLPFFDHMLEMLGWYADLNVDASYAALTHPLQHVVCEDIGLALGSAARQVIVDRIPEGIECRGDGHAVMDESVGFSMVSFEGRSNAFFTVADAAAREFVEGMQTVDLVAFFEGFSQGARATVHLRLTEGADPHHAWEAGFRAFAHALRAALRANPRRAGLTAGVKGTLD